MAPIAITVKIKAQIKPVVSREKLSRPMDNEPSRTAKLSQERKVRSLAKKTFGSTRVGRAMRFPASCVRD